MVLRRSRECLIWLDAFAREVICHYDVCIDEEKRELSTEMGMPNWVISVARQRRRHWFLARRLPGFTLFWWPISPGINFRDFFLQHLGSRIKSLI